jgi:hypothetical protein
MMINRYAILLSFCLFGCITSGIVQTGPDSYMAKAQSTLFTIDPGVVGAIQTAVEDANEFCAKQGKGMVVMNTQAVPHGACGNATVNFVCLDKNGPAYWQPNLQTVPNTEVQVTP